MRRWYQPQTLGDSMDKQIRDLVLAQVPLRERPIILPSRSPNTAVFDNNNRPFSSLKASSMSRAESRAPASQSPDPQAPAYDLAMLPNGRAKRFIPPGNLGRRIFHQPLGRFQPSRAIPIPVALAPLRTVLVVLSSKRVARPRLQ